VVSLKAAPVRVRQFLQRPCGIRPTAIFAVIALGAILGIAPLPAVTAGAQAAASAHIPSVAISPPVSAASTLAGKSTDAAFAWGDNTTGALGTGYPGLTDVPTPLMSSGVLQGKTITAMGGGEHSGCAVALGKAYCWGNYNGSGGPGSDGVIASAPTVAVPVSTSGVLAGKFITALSVGEDHTCVIASGLPYCWGSNEMGDLGVPTATFVAQVPVAVDVSGALAGKTVSAISAGGGWTTCALADGAPYCWGFNAEGQLGNNTTTNSAVPVAVDLSGVLAGKSITSLQVGSTTTCALASGRVYCWGAQGAGTLGTSGTPQNSWVPATVDWTGVLAGKVATALSLTYSTACVIADGSPYCWGANGNGNLGAGSDLSASYVPVAVVTTGVLAGRSATTISSGMNHTCVLASGQPFCWGNDYDGELGDGSLNPSSVPVAVVTNGALSGRTITQIVAGWGSSFALTAGAPNTPMAAGTFTSLASVRVLDTRIGLGAASKGPLPAGASVALQILGRGGVPTTSVSAVEFNLTAVGPSSGGYLSAYPDGSTPPGTSNLNFAPGQTTSNLVIVPVGADGKVRLFNGSAGSVQLVADLAGYYLPGTPVTAGAFNAVTPARLLDTRGAAGPLAARTSIALKVLGRDGVPATGVAAVAFNVTAVGPSSGGYLSAYPDGSTPPGTSNLNFAPGQTASNLVIVPVGTDGDVRLLNGSAGKVQLVADLAGYFLPGAPIASGAFWANRPRRVLDTRIGLGSAGAGPVPALGSTSVQVLDHSARRVAGASAVVLNLIAVVPSSGGYLSIYPDGSTPPGTSSLSFAKGQTISNLSVDRVGPDGKVRVLNGSAGQVNVIADVAGCYLDGT
jgi:alpha-tubulin suppressor-like RCC1 family protein